MTNKLIFFLFLSVSLSSCAPEWLDVKKDQKMVVPTTNSDLQALLDNTYIFNFAKSPSLGEISSDDIKLNDEQWLSTSSLWQKNAYLWESDIFQGIPSQSNGWDLPYRQVFYANVVLEGLDKLQSTKEKTKEWQETHGAALFWRSWAFYHLVQIFSNAYNAKTASSDPGIPLPLESDVNIKHKRATLEQSYHQIQTDLEKAILFLPTTVPYPTRPSQSAAYGLLARVYLQKGDYNKSYENAALSYSLSKGIMDFNTISPAGTYSFEQFNKEVILENSMEHYSSGILAYSKFVAHPTLLQSYTQADLRKTLFFDSSSTGQHFKGSYSGTLFLFSGISSNEVLLIKMESAFRMGKVPEALELYNLLLRMRTKDTLYVAKEKITLDDILLQRRLELPFRGLRWTDIKRLNTQGYNIELQRNILGKTYNLPSNDNRYSLPIPPDVIAINPGIVQNPR